MLEPVRSSPITRRVTFRRRRRIVRQWRTRNITTAATAQIPSTSPSDGPSRHRLVPVPSILLSSPCERLIGGVTVAFFVGPRDLVPDPTRGTSDTVDSGASVGDGNSEGAPLDSSDAVGASDGDGGRMGASDAVGIRDSGSTGTGDRGGVGSGNSERVSTGNCDGVGAGTSDGVGEANCDGVRSGDFDAVASGD